MSTTKIIQPYLFFCGRCEEALKYYRTHLGAEVEMMMRYRESPEPTPPCMLAEGWEDKIMHASFRIGETTVMAADGCSSEGECFEGFRLSLSLPDEAKAQKAFASLSEGGEVGMPLAKTFWAPLFGMCSDQFGLGWMITAPH
jgi:PhnB protein